MRARSGCILKGSADDGSFRVIATESTESPPTATYLVPLPERYDDQLFSFADAVSFEVMSERGVREALTLDNHFGAAGFVVVPQKKGIAATD